MIRLLARLLFGKRREPSAAETEDEGVGPVDPLDPLKRDEELPGADPVVAPIPPEV